jgi:hypothetical protein
MAQYIVLPDGTRCYSGPNCLRHGNKGLPSDFASKSVTEQLADMERIKNPLSIKEPKEIDTQIADLYETYYSASQPLVAVLSRLKAARKRLERERIERFREGTERDIEYLEGKANEHRAVMKQILEEVVPYEVEYKRRPWTRGFLVRNANGHVHKTMSCSTCTPSTQYYWLTEYSGKDEGELVGDAGERACTVCYPSAPVNILQRPSRIQDPTLRAQQEERDARVAERERKAAEKEAKAIYAPNGLPLKDSSGFQIKTLITAENNVSEIHSELRAVKEGKYTIRNPQAIIEREETYARIMEAIAYKKGLTVEEAEKELEAKFERKFKKDWN